MPISLTFLGTGGSVPSKYRNLPSVLLRRGPDVLLFDCGEGTQRQFLQAKAGVNRKMRIFISHLHGDHIFGLPGLLTSLSFLGRTRDLEIIGPRGIVQFIESIDHIVKLYSQYSVHVREVRPGRVVNDSEYEVYAANARHGVPCLAYSFREKMKPGRFDPGKAKRLGIPEGPLWKKLQTQGQVKIGRRKIDSRLVMGPPRRGVKITYAVDTRPCASVAKLAANSDLLIHDSSFAEAAATKAKDYGHSTAIEAAQLAKNSRVRKLALFHISAMYEDPSPLLAEARKVFPQTFLSKDMATIEVAPR
jgi:ribonuclease Z